MFTPEHLHVALNHVPLIGLTVAVIPLLLGLFRKDRGALLSGLLIVLVCSLSIPVVMETGDSAAVRLLSGDAGIAVDPVSAYWIKEHEERADVTAAVVYVALATMGFAPKYLYKAAAAVLAACILCTALLVWTAQAGGCIRHPEFRPAATGK